MNNDLKHYGVRGMKWGKHKFGKDDSAAKAFNTAYNTPFSPFATNGYGQLGKVLNTSLIGLQGNRNDLNALRTWDAATKATANKQASVNNLPQNLLDFAKKRFNINSGSSANSNKSEVAGGAADAFSATKTGSDEEKEKEEDKKKKKESKANKTKKSGSSGQKRSSNSGRGSSGGGERIRSGGGRSGGSGGRSGGSGGSGGKKKGGERIRSGGGRSGGSGGRSGGSGGSGGKKKGGEKMVAQDVTGAINDPKEVQNKGQTATTEAQPETTQTSSQQATSDVVRGNAQTSVNSQEALSLIEQYRAFVDQLLKAFMTMGYSRQQSDARAEQVAENVYTPGTADAKVKTKKRG